SPPPSPSPPPPPPPPATPSPLQAQATEDILQTFVTLYAQALDGASQPGGVQWTQEPRAVRNQRPSNVVGEGDGEVCR
ncbi:MAG: hypothetical protein Q8M78_11230, partial [Burkholderiaceae bacterium]|nr:hypothetical protein [Burkholderiaceae bacterium]